MYSIDSLVYSNVDLVVLLYRRYYISDEVTTKFVGR